MWRRVPCEQQLNMGQSVLRDAVKTVGKVLVLLNAKAKGLERVLGNKTLFD